MISYKIIRSFLIADYFVSSKQKTVPPWLIYLLTLKCSSGFQTHSWQWRKWKAFSGNSLDEKYLGLFYDLLPLRKVNGLKITILGQYLGHGPMMKAWCLTTCSVHEHLYRLVINKYKRRFFLSKRFLLGQECQNSQEVPIETWTSRWFHSQRWLGVIESQTAAWEQYSLSSISIRAKQFNHKLVNTEKCVRYWTNCEEILDIKSILCAKFYWFKWYHVFSPSY